MIRERIFSNWHLMRIVRLAIGIWMLVFGIQTSDWLVGLFSAFFIYMAIADTGCCGTGVCYNPPRRNNHKVQEIPADIEYEEVK